MNNHFEQLKNNPAFVKKYKRRNRSIWAICGDIIKGKILVKKKYK